MISSHKLSSDAKPRLETMTATSDGFEIAEVDLKLRGPGDLMGTKQSGVLQLKIADIIKDNQNTFTVQIANDNSDGQIVLSGKNQDLEELGFILKDYSIKKYAQILKNIITQMNFLKARPCMIYLLNFTNMVL